MPFDWTRFFDDAALEEGLFFDRKSTYPITEEKRADVIEDLIAFANTSRLTGMECHLLLGVSDELSRDGLPNLPNDPGKRVKAWEGFKHKLVNISKTYITPELRVEVSNLQEIGGKHFAVLTFSPTSYPKPFEVRKGFENKNNQGKPKTILASQSWIRSGESNEEIKPGDVFYSLNFGLVPLLLPLQWKAYCLAQMGWLTSQRKTPTEMYQRLKVASNKYADEALKEFVDSENQLFILEGVAGSGKSTLLRNVCQDLMNDFDFRCSSWQRNEIMRSLGIVPIYFPLRHDQDNNKLAKRVTSSIFKANHKGTNPDRIFDLPSSKWVVMLDGFDECSPQRQKSLADEIRQLIDGYQSIKVILSTRPIYADWAALFVGCPITHKRLLPLEEEQIRNFLASQSLEKNVADEATRWLMNQPEMKEIMHWPMYLHAGYDYLIPQPTATIELDSAIQPKIGETLPNSTALQREVDVTETSEAKTEVEWDGILDIGEVVLNSPQISEDKEDSRHQANLETDDSEVVDLKVSVLLDRVMSHLLKRESNLHQKTKTNSWQENLREIAWVGGDDTQPLSWSNTQKKLTSTGMNWFLNLGILRELPPHARVIFLNHLTRCYFAVGHIRTLLETSGQNSCQVFLQKHQGYFASEVIALAQDLTDIQFQTLSNG